ncbi:MAG TPA: FAD-binding oxidoreductase [Caulobacteraceae bacterium]
MRRRSLLKGAAAAALAFASSPAMALAAPRHRARPGTPGWPSEADWSRLKDAVGGRLVKPEPIAAACETDAKSAACTALIKNLGNPYYIGDQAGGTQVSGWLDAWTPKVSAFAVKAQSSADVAAAVSFARRHDLRLAVKGGAHSYQGGSNAPDSLLVWTRAMNRIKVHDAFTPAGGTGPGVPAVSIGAGAVWADAYDAVTTKAGRYVQGGGCATVGVAGLVLGGGFGSFSKRYGTGGASLIEAEIVTADGRVRIVNAHRDPDLYWALKGAGQCAFGVVTRVTLKTHELGARGGGFNLKVTAKSDEAFRRLLAAFVDVIAEGLINPHWGESVQVTRSNRLEVNMVFLDLDSKEARAAWKPLTDLVSASPADFKLEGPRALAQPMRDWWDFAAMRAARAPYARYDTRPGAPPNHAWWDGDSDQVSMFLYGYDSLWLPDSLLQGSERPRLADALFAASRHFDVGLHFNKGLAGAPPDAIAASRDTATNPKVLNAFALAIIADGGFPDYPGYPQSNLAKAHDTAHRIDAATAELKRLAPEGGSYISESNYFNADWRRAYWGPHYPRLAAIKSKYDPTDLFIMHHGVGSEAWSSDGMTRGGPDV